MSDLTPLRQLGGLLGWLALTFVAAFIGATASIEAADFYAALQRPDWAPPGWLFGPVWTLLYLMMGVAVWLVWRRGGPVTVALALYVIQLLVNALWSWLFFGWRLGAYAMIDIVILWLLIAVTLVAFYRHSQIAGWLLVPYLAWVSFASGLNYAVWQLNPDLLS